VHAVLNIVFQHAYVKHCIAERGCECIKAVPYLVFGVVCDCYKEKMIEILSKFSITEYFPLFFIQENYQNDSEPFPKHFEVLLQLTNYRNTPVCTASPAYFTSTWSTSV